MTDKQRTKYPSSRVERTSRRLVHCIAQCKECEWMEDSYLRAARAATKHMRTTGHAVGVDQGIVYTVRLRDRR